MSLALRKPPALSWYLPCQVSIVIMAFLNRYRTLRFFGLILIFYMKRLVHKRERNSFKSLESDRFGSGLSPGAIVIYSIAQPVRAPALLELDFMGLNFDYIYLLTCQLCGLEKLLSFPIFHAIGCI